MLSNQQESLRKRLSLRSPPTFPSTTATPCYTSLSSSPTSDAHRSDMYTPPTTYSYQPRSSRPVPTMPGYAHSKSATMHSACHDAGMDNDSKALCQINQQIKATLTEMLNNDSVKHDEKFRAWIQSRLMDAEMELKQQRRRRSSASVDNREIASSIAEHFDPHHAAIRWSPSF